MFTVAAVPGLLICACLVKTQDCSWDVAITTSMSPCTNTSLMMRDSRDPEAIMAGLSVDEIKNVKARVSFLCPGGECGLFEQSLLARIKCKTVEESRARSRTYASAGGKVHITLRYRALFQQPFPGDHYEVKQFSAAMMDIGGIPGCDSYGKCPPGAFCDPVWIVPFQRETTVLMVNGMMVNEGTGHLFPMKSFIAELTGLMPNVSSRQNSDLTPLQTAVIPLIHMPHASPFIILGGFDNASTLLLTQTEFESVVISRLEDVYPEILTRKSVCDCDAQYGKPRLYATGSLSDRHLLLTSAGLIEVYGLMTYFNETDASRDDSTSGEKTTLTKRKSFISFERCAHKMILPIHDTDIYHFVMLTGACQHKGRLYVARIRAKVDKELGFMELLPPDGKPLGSMFPAPSHIIATAQSAASGGQFYTLLKTSQSGSPVYAVTMITGVTAETSSSQLLSIIPEEIPSTSLDEPLMLSQAWLMHGDPTEKLILRGISVTARLSGHLFLWGSRILHSPDFGHTFYLLPVCAPHGVVLFEMSRHGQMLFLTAHQEMFVGVTQLSKVKKIWPSDAWDIVHARHNLPTLPPDSHIVTVFFDKTDDIQLLYVSTNGTPSSVLKHSVPLNDILALVAFEDRWIADNHIQCSQGITRVDIQVQPLCPFSLIRFDLTGVKRYTKLQEVMLSAPFALTKGRVNWHTNTSLLLYHAIIKNITRYMKTFHTETYTKSILSPLDRWKAIFLIQQPFYKYIFQTNHFGTPEYFQTESIQLIEHKIMQTTKLPDIIYLDKLDNFKFTMTVMPSRKGDLDSLRIGVLVSNSSLVAVNISEHWDMLKNTVTYEVDISHTGIFNTQMMPGIELNSESVQLLFHGAPLYCYRQTEKDRDPQGLHQLSVMLGCPPNLHVLFDWNATKNRLYEDDIQQIPIDCLYPDPSLPCFYFDNGFYPVFRVFDDTLFKSWVFEGRYTLKVIGGSSDPKTIRKFTEDEIYAYNNKLGSRTSLIWSGNTDIMTTDGYDLYHTTTNGIRWLCQPKSPCSMVKPNFPQTPEFFLLIEFSNRFVDRSRTNCDLTFSFLVHLHGLPIDAVSISLVIVWVVMGFICLYVLIYFLVYCRGARHIYKDIQIYYHTKVKCLFHKTTPENLQNTVRMLYSNAMPIIMCDNESETSNIDIPFNNVPSSVPDSTHAKVSAEIPEEETGDNEAPMSRLSVKQTHYIQ